jgi:uncharacterized protein
VSSFDRLYYAWKAGGSLALRELLNAGADPRSVDEIGIPILSAVASGGDADAISALLDAGADIEAGAPPDYWSPLITAANCGNAEAVAILLRRGANANALTRDGYSAYGRTPPEAEDVRLLLLAAGARWPK